MSKVMTQSELQDDVTWTRQYINQIKEANRQGNYALACELASEISAIWATIAGQFDDAA
jgi:hypothetical protein